MTDRAEMACELHENLREIWAIVSENPGISLGRIAQKAGFSKTKAFRLVGLLKKSGTLIAPGSSHGTLQATVPMITVRKDNE